MTTTGTAMLTPILAPMLNPVGVGLEEEEEEEDEGKNVEEVDDCTRI